MTNLLHWSDDYTLGIPAMDADHRILMTLCNDVLRLLHDHQPGSAVADGLDVLVARTRKHFDDEEQALDRAGYPDLTSHRDEHDRLIRDAQALAAQLRRPEQADMDRILAESANFLQYWLLEHIRGSDRPYQPFLRNLT